MTNDRRMINFVESTQKKPNKTVILTALLVLVLLVGAMVKFGVVDRFSAAAKAEEAANAAKTQLDETYALLRSRANNTPAPQYDSLESDYADRTQTLFLIENILIPAGDVRLWSLLGNELRVTMTVSSQKELDALVSRLEDNLLILSCEVEASADIRAAGKDATMANLVIGLASEGAGS